MLWSLFGAPAPTSAGQIGDLAGAVYDQTGAALIGVSIAIEGLEDRHTETDAAGRFVLAGLQHGDYELRARLAGFESLSRDVRVRAGETVSLSLTMIVAVLEETVVTASKAGAEDVQSTPLAVTALPAGELTRLSTPTIDQAAATMPSVTFTQNGSFGQLSIRGIGTNAVNAGADPSSAMYLDGVYLARPAMAFVDFLDLDRVEVLRGPQGTLYGRNAVGGAVNLISKPPTSDFDAYARVTAGNLDELRVEARASGTLKRDRLLGSVAFARGVREGYVRDLDHPDRRLGEDDAISARGQLQILFDHRTNLLVTTDVSDQDGALLTFNKVLQVKPGFVVDNPPDLHAVRTSTVAASGLRTSGATLRLTSAVSPTTTLVSLSAFRTLDNEFLVDADVTELALLSTHIHERQQQFSQELTLSQRRPRLTWVGGVFFFDERDHQQIWVDQMTPQTQVQLDPRVDATSGAAFAQATIALPSRLSVTGGFRYTRERKTIDNAGGLYRLEPPNAPVPGSGYSYADAIVHSAWTPKAGVEMRLPGGTLTYLSATRGFKSGGFNLSSTVPGRGFAPEWAWSYEAGLKTELLDHRVRLNTAAFHMDYRNLQVQTPVGIGVFDIRNAAAATIRGVEIETSSRIAGGIDAGGHITWLDARYDRYIAVGPGGVTGDVAGNRLNNAPQWAGRLWLEWTGNVGSSGRLSAAAEVTAQSTVFYTPFNDMIQRQVPYGLLGARAEYAARGRRWSVNAYGRNLTDTDYIMATFATSPAAFGGRPALSRQFGIQFTVRR